MCRKYERQGGQPPAHERKDGPHPQQQSSCGIEQHVNPPSKQLGGVHRTSPIMAAIVQGEGSNAISFPPIDTINMSSLVILSRINPSCWVK
mmetsp:Transcript_6687/g.9705  ORF Transcript_6687/g.9705 Transcript_6687/m.9705 type:complete len:91 (-) Transcript_6687:466-738(-)